MNKMHVCMISYGFHPPWVEGCSVIARDLALALRDYVELSIISVRRIDYLSPEINNEKQCMNEVEKNLRIYDLRASSLFRFARIRGKFLLPDQILTSVKVWSALKSLDSKHRIDVVHMYNVSHLIMSSLVKNLLRRPAVAHVFSGSSGSLGEKISKRFVDAYICTSKLSYLRLLSKGFSKHEVYLIPPIIDCNVCRPLTKEDCRKKLKISNDSFVISYIGNLYPERFPLNVIVEIKKLLKVNPNIEVALYAPYSARNKENGLRLKRLLSKAKVKHRVKIFNLNEGEKTMVYNASDVLIFPFIKRISGNIAIDPPLTILEGMACGKIVIASKTSSIPEIIDHNENGFLVEPGDYKDLRNTLEYVIKHFSELEYLGECAREKVLKIFSTEATVKKLMAVYQSILN